MVRKFSQFSSEWTVNKLSDNNESTQNTKLTNFGMNWAWFLKKSNATSTNVFDDINSPQKRNFFGLLDLCILKQPIFHQNFEIFTHF